jgi:hypothetical protein
VEKPHDVPRAWTLIWAVRAVPALLALGALDLFYDDLPIWFLTLTLVRLALGVATLVALRLGAREEWCAAYVGVVFVTSLVHPQRAAVLLAFSALALVMTVFDVRRRRAATASGAREPATGLHTPAE